MAYVGRDIKDLLVPITPAMGRVATSCIMIARVALVKNVSQLKEYNFACFKT